MSNQRHAPRSLLHRVGIAGPARVRAFDGTGAPSRALIATPLIALAALFGLFAFSAAPALAANGHGFSSSFGGEESTVKDPEPLSGPTGIAVNEKTKEIDVLDTGHNRVERFSETGAYEGQFTGEAAPTAPTGAFSSPNAIAVDNDPSSPSYGDIYVSDAGHNVIDKFEPAGVYVNQLAPTTEAPFVGGLSGIAVDPTGHLWVYEAEEGYASQFDNSIQNGFLSRTYVGVGGPLGIAVDSTSDLYIINAFSKNLQKYLGTAPEELLGTVDACGCVTGVAVDPQSNNVYADQGTTVAEYGPFGEPYKTLVQEPPFGLGILENGTGMTVSASTHVVYVADSKANDIDVFTEGPKPTVPVSENPGTIEGLSATLKGKLEGGENSYHFSYATNGTCQDGTTTPATPATGSENVAVKITGLTAHTKYTYCLFAENKYGQESSLPITFETTPSVPVVGKTSSTVKLATASFSASVNPELEPSTCVFQYGKSEDYEDETPCQPATLGEGETSVPVTANVKGLEPNTTYDFRVLATNHTGNQPGPNETFTTEPITPTQVETAPAIDVTATSAMIGGQANPQGGATYYVEYGFPTCSLNGVPNFAWWLCATKSGEAGPLSGDTLQTVTPIQITGLMPGTTYRYWIVAHNVNGSERGEEAMFTTPSATPPVVTSLAVLTPALFITPPPPSAPIKPPIKKKAAAQEKAERLSKALKQCQKEKPNAKRKTCQAQARKRYGATTKSKLQSHKRGK